jgi:hypothetical protein
MVFVLLTGLAGKYGAISVPRAKRSFVGYLKEIQCVAKAQAALLAARGSAIGREQPEVVLFHQLQS